MRIVDTLAKSIQQTATFNPEVQVAPVCILWPDHDRQWEAIIPRLQEELLELFVLGPYDATVKKGPAIWLRCVLADKIKELSIPEEKTLIFYLPGVSRQDLRAVDTCPEELKPLSELQYRGVFWSQNNTKDWTILAFLKSEQGGVGLDITQDNATRIAAQSALPRLLDVEIEPLKIKRLDKQYFNTLLTSGDPMRDLLQWLDQCDTFRASRNEAEWKAFVEVCKEQFAFNPEKEGILHGLTKLATHEGPWLPVWQRFCEAPTLYSHIPTQIRKCRPPNDSIFWHCGEGNFDGWPQWNEEQEASLQKDLTIFGSNSPHEVREKIIELDKHHSCRRNSIWAELGESVLAQALEYLSVLAKVTGSSLASGSIEDLVAGYRASGWIADDALLKALSYVEKSEDVEAVSKIARTIYIPWAEQSARYLQKVVEKEGYPRNGKTQSNNYFPQDGVCVFFIDGLRFDLARRLSTKIAERKCKVTEKTVWAALPSVTATGKPAVTPVWDQITGQEVNADFEPCVAKSGQSLKGGAPLKKLLKESGWKILNHASPGDGKGKAWYEFGDIDHEGHNRGWKLSKHVDDILNEICDRIFQLFSAGWINVRIVTDHGWLLLPQGLPKTDLPLAVAENKWGRCAAIKSGAAVNENLFPWHWNPNQFFVLADGISCFRNGIEYAHGGLSLQECLNLELDIVFADRKTSMEHATISSVNWKGLRCTVEIAAEGERLYLDLRTQAGDPTTRVVADKKEFKENRVASVLVNNEDLDGSEATIVLLDEENNLVAQVATIIGGGSK